MVDELDGEGGGDDGSAVNDTDTVVESETRPLPLTHVDAETETETLPDAEEVTDRDWVGVSEGCVEDDTEVVGEGLSDALIEGTVVPEAFADWEGPVEALPLMDGDGVAEIEARTEEETLVDTENTTEAETAAVGVMVSDPKLLPEGARDTLADHEAQADTDTLEDELPEAVLEGEGRGDTEGEVDSEGLEELSEERDGDCVKRPERVSDPLAVASTVSEVLRETAGDAEVASVELSEAVERLLIDGSIEDETVPESLIEGERLADGVGDTESLAEGEKLAEGVDVPMLESDGEAVDEYCEETDGLVLAREEEDDDTEIDAVSDSV